MSNTGGERAHLVRRASAGRRASAFVDPERTKTERIRLDDCKNVIELMDEVAQGKLRATLAALQAGNFGGVGTLAQVVFAGVGVAFAAVATIAAVYMPLDKYIFAGMPLLYLAAALAVARSWNLRKLKALLRAHKYRLLQPALQNSGTETTSTTGGLLSQQTEHSDDGGVEMGEKGAAAATATVSNPAYGEGGAECAAELVAPQPRFPRFARRARAKQSLSFAKATDSLNRKAELSLCALAWVAVVFISWLDTFYCVAGGDLQLEPFLPSDPGAAYFVCFAVGLATSAVLVLRFAWLLQGAHVKLAQRWAVRICASLGATFFALAVQSPSVIGAALLGLLALTFLGAGCGLIIYLRHRQRAAMTRELRQDIANYETAWAAICGSVDQVTHVQSIGAKLAVVVEDKVAARPSFELEQRSTAEQLVIMLAQAWGLNDKFQDVAEVWKAELLRQGQLAASHTGGEQEQGLLPKRRKRAIEKVWRGYQGDATRLRDLVRCSLVFDTFAQMEAALDLILADSAIRVLRVKNRFAEDYDAVTESCGYRDIQLNAVLTQQVLTEAGEIELGLHEHVCEIQLHLHDIYKFKNEMGHKRYVEYRNRRAE
jgi:hypothetical protein